MSSKNFSFCRMTSRRLSDAEILRLLESEDGEAAEDSCTDDEEDQEILDISNSEDSDDDYFPPDENEYSSPDENLSTTVSLSQPYSRRKKPLLKVLHLLNRQMRPMTTLLYPLSCQGTNILSFQGKNL